MKGNSMVTKKNEMEKKMLLGGPEPRSVQTSPHR